ncbi:ATP-binding domain-containing protein [Anaeromyxobacter oryzisoli]|uniref:ATP-binding domain-containing protein n=1 Tax=Anaeromyxobacter oryzisoli TaxID=2925408 RepID=UPI001F56EB73|nr:ATP-binding domain-containing protein [Anaeromyxobacter sp. SG63]
MSPNRTERAVAPEVADLSAAERALVAEEEAVLAAVQRALAERRAALRGEGDLVSRLRELRDEALESMPKDLPTVFQEMGLVRAVMERTRGGALPDPAAPYFAHLRVREGGEVRDYCLGRHTFVDRAAGVRVVDWRFAPVAGIFYRYREGEEFEEAFPGRISAGVVEARRVVVVERGVLVRISAGARALSRRADGRWRSAAAEIAALAGGEGTAARAGALGTGAGVHGRAAAPELTALLDPEQFEAIASPADRPLLVLGSAGSGKTTVALHRLARIAFEDPRRFPPGRLQVVVPEVGLARLAARLLEPLGLEKAPVRTLDAWSRGAFQSAFGAPPPRLYPDTPPLVARLKRHPALFELLRRRPHLAREKPPLLRLRRELGDLLVDRAFLEGVVRAAAGDLPTTAIEETIRHTRLQLAPPSDDLLAGVDPDRRETLDGKPIDEDTPAAVSGTLDPEDLPLLLFLSALRAGVSGKRTAHLVVDEAEDVSLFELYVLGRHLAGRSATLAGDESQQTFSSYAGWPQALAALGAEGAATVRLETTYRCPRPIAEVARAILGPLAPAAPPRAGRDGAPVSRLDFPTEAHAHLFLAGALRDLLEREPRASAAVICHAPEVARGIHRLLADLPEARLALDGKLTFRPGVDVTDVASVKGLEFDYVVVPDVTARAYPDADEARRRLHVAVTRAAHQLWLVVPGTPSPLLRGVRTG